MGAANLRLWNADLIKKYDVSGPRYTSYPTALQFSEDVGYLDWKLAVDKSNETKAPLSFYFHVPFCDTVCYYCACNRIITANKKVAAPYTQNLIKEFELQSRFIDTSRNVQQIHWGGGTPTYLDDEAFEHVFDVMDSRFNIDRQNSEISIEVHPASVDSKRIGSLRNIGFNRLSMGIQDFDPKVQSAVNRFNSVAEVERLVKSARKNNYQSLSMDLIYGLPFQHCESFKKTLSHVIELGPDRLSLFNYAHMPERFKTQRQIDARALPEPQEKLAILQQSIEQLNDAGYVYIGMDHFAKPDDELVKAQRNASLHRNFQGYSTRSACDMFGFGLTSISSIQGNIFQNTKNQDQYAKSIETGALPISKGFKLNNDDLIRAELISQLTCNFQVKFTEIEQQFNIIFKDYFARELALLPSMEIDGLVKIFDDEICVLDSGRMLVRRICMLFDAYFNDIEAQQTQKYSRII